MEQSDPARESSGIYDADHGSQHSFSSDAELREHASQPAGVATRTAAGVPVTATGAGAAMGLASDWGDQPNAPPAQSQQPKVPLYKRRWFIITVIVVALLGIALLFIILFPVIRAIVQLVVKRTQIDIERATITSPTNNSFDLRLEGNVTHTGIFSASIKFTENVDVFWLKDPNNSTGIKLGSMGPLDELHARNKRAKINQTQHFEIEDQAAFSEFTRFLITAPTFSWRIHSSNLRVQALKFPVATGITFDKQIVLKGINNFSGNIVLLDFQLPRDDPAGGIDFVAVTQLNNESPFVLQLGTTAFDLAYDGVRLGSGISTRTVIDTGPNNITLMGRLEPITNPSDLPKVSTLFTNYLNGDTSQVIASGRSTFQEDGTIIQWLSDGLESLQLDVPFKSLVPIDPIRSITIGDMALSFTPESPWTPGITSNTIQASLELPFGFNLSIGQIRNDFDLVKDGDLVAGLSTPLGASTSSITVHAEDNTTGTINITIANTSLISSDDEHAAFSAFNTNLTGSDITAFRLIGNSSAVANLSIGQLTLDPIRVNVSTFLLGLQGLQNLVRIEGVDVTGGTTDAIELGINVTITNPSNLNLSTGDLTLRLLRNGTLVGTTLLPGLNLRRGDNAIQATSNFTANESQEGLMTLNDFIGHTDVQLSIAGFDGSTGVQSLVGAFESLDISVILPGMTTNLLANASLTVLPTSGRENNICHVTVSLNNPFSAPLRVTRIASAVTSHNISLGTIDFITDFSLPPHSVTQSPALDFNMNFDPSALFTVTRALAVEAGLDPTPLDGIVQLGGIGYSFVSGQPQAGPQGASTFVDFDLPTFIQDAFKGLQTDVQLMTVVSIGDYQTVLEYAQTSVPTATDDSLNLILPVLAQPIIERIVSNSTLGLDTIMITNPQEDSFGTQLVGSIGRTGPFDAMIAFPSGLDVNWLGNDLGSVQMGPINVTGDADSSAINMQSIFNVQSVNALANFTTHLITDPSFDWHISGKNLTVSALGIHVPGITLPQKQVTLKGFNSLKRGITVKTFSLPSDNTVDGGINLNLEASTNNPSDVGIQLDTIEFETMSGETMIAHISASNATLAPRLETNMSFSGRLVPQNNSDSGRKEVSQIFNRYIAGNNSKVTVHGAGGPKGVSWLDAGIKALIVETDLPADGVQDHLINTIDLSGVALAFSEDLPYSPLTNSSVAANFSLPSGFHFTLDFSAITQHMSVSFDGTPFANLAFSEHAGSEGGIIHVDFNNTHLEGVDGENKTFDGFLADAVNVKSLPIDLKGLAQADVQTAIGSLTLENIMFKVGSAIPGLQGLNTQAVSDVDVNHGFQDFLLIKANGALSNPNPLTIGTGTVNFTVMFRDRIIGTAGIDNMMVHPGNGTQPINVHYRPQDEEDIAAGRQLLQNFLLGVDANVSIVGTEESTKIASLKQAFKRISFPSVSIPAFKDTLIKNVSLTFPLDIVDKGFANSNFTLANPFNAAINLVQVNATAVFQNLTLGSINNDTSSDPIHAGGQSTVTSRVLPFGFNLDPVAIISLLRLTSAQNSVPLDPLDDLLQFVLDNPDFKPPVKTSVDTSGPVCVSGHQVDILGAILMSLENLNVNLTIDTTVLLDEFRTELTLQQNSIPAATDNTSLFLIGAVAGPIAQHLVDLSQLNFTEAHITNITDDGFDLALNGSLTNTGPLDASIEFIEPLTVIWQGRQIAQIVLPSVCAAADVGVPDYETTAHVIITNQGDFTDFAELLLHNESFTWTIQTDALRLRALNTIFDNVTLSKDLIFKAFNNLPNVTIENFQLPSNDPEGGIRIETDAKIPSPAQLGIQLGHVTFQTFFQEVLVGPLAADNLSLEPNAVTETHLTGRIIPQSGKDLETIGILFSEVLAGHNVTLETRGDSVQPPGTNAPVTWLSNAFKTLSLSVILPAQHFDVIKAIQLDDLKVIMEKPEQTFAPLTSSEHTVARYANPFGFSLQVVEASETLILNVHGVDAAQLDLPKASVDGGVSTGNVVDLVISFENQTLKALDHTAFAQIFAGVALTPELDFLLKGSTNVTANTPIGNVPITGIPINVTSGLKGIDSFGGTASLSNVSVTGSGGARGSEYILSPLTTTLQNPSNISLSTIGVTLPVVYQKTKIGRSVINIFDLVPGENTVPTEFHYEPDNANDTVAQSFLTNFIQTGGQLDLTIDGDDHSSPFDSLRPALDGLTLHTSLNGLNQPNIITHVHVIITLESLITNLVTVEFQVHNPLDADMFIEFVQSDSGVNGKTYAFFRQPFKSFYIKAGETAGSGLIPNVLLTQGALASLDIIPLGVLDVHAANSIRIGSPHGYLIPWLKLEQTNVPTSYDLALGFSSAGVSLSGLIGQAKDILTHNSSISSLPASTAAVSSTGGVSDGEVTGSTSSVPEETQSVNNGSPSNSEATPAPATSSAAAVQPTADTQPEDKAKASSPATVAAIHSAAPETSMVPGGPS